MYLLAFQKNHIPDIPLMPTYWGVNKGLMLYLRTKVQSETSYLDIAMILLDGASCNYSVQLIILNY